MDHPPAPEAGTALVHITAAHPAHARAVAELLEDVFGGTRPAAYPLPGQDGVRLEMLLDVAGRSLPALGDD